MSEMRSRMLSTLFMAALMLSAFSGAFAPQSVLGSSPVSAETVSSSVPEIPETFSFDINIVFLGIEESRIDGDLLSRLPQWYAPLVQNTYFILGDIVYDLNFTINYHTTFLDEDAVRDYRSFIYENSVEDLAPQFIQPEHSVARYIHSSLVEEYLAENVVDSPHPTLIIIDTYTYDPQGHTHYYYNASYNELDAELGGFVSNPIPWASTYQIAGGGRDNRLIWLDLSAGPTEYEAYGEPGSGAKLEVVGVSEDTVPPVWEYDGFPDAKSKFNEDIVLYIAKAVELRLLRAYTFAPAYAHDEIRLEMLMVDLDPSSFDFWGQINTDYMVTEFEQLNPYVEWTYSAMDWDWESDAEFRGVLHASYDEASGTYDASRIFEHLDGRFKGLFNETTEERFVIPIIFFGMPENRRFTPDIGANTGAVGDQFSYIISKQSRDLADPEHVETEIITFDGIIVPPGGYFNITGDVGRANEKVELSVDVQRGALNVYVLDEHNYERYKGSLSFEDLLGGSMEGLSESTGAGEVEFSTGILGRIILVFEDAGGSGATFNLRAKVSQEKSIGFTWKTMHEIEHALGLDHPFEGFSWGNYEHPSAALGRYTYRMWDMSYTQTAYSHFAPTLSIMDIDTLQRGFIPRYWRDAERSLEALIDAEVSGENVEEVKGHLMRASQSLEESITHYGENKNPNHYMKSLESIFDSLNELELASALIKIDGNEDSTGISSSMLLLAIMVVLILGAVLYFKRLENMA